VFGGLGLGAPLGEAVFHAHGSTAVWVLAAAFCAAAFVFGLSVPAFAPGIDGVGVPPPRRQLLQPDALRPGVVLALAMTGVAAFSTFVPVYVGSIGVENAAIVFTINACIILAVRLTSARIPDRWGSLRTATRCLSVMSLGLAAIGLVGSPAGLYTATVVYSLGQSLIYPALLPLAIGRAPVSERSNAMATFTLFFDVSQGLGAVVLGAVVALANERAAFLVAAAVVFSALFVLRLGPLGREAPAPAAAEAA
jgi:MFS family permease